MQRGDIQQLINEVKANTGAPMGHATSLPAAFYTDPTILEVERKALFEPGWLFICRNDQVPSNGDYHTADTAAGPVLIIRGDDGEVRAFANLCRHRGSILLEGHGNCRRIVCPYHAWSYRTTGTLAAAPEMEDTPDFSFKDNGLITIRMETWGGFIFVNMKDDAPSLLEWLGDMPSRMASHQLEEMRHVWTLTLEAQCNWKLLIENAIEAYHTGLVHRETVGAQESRDIGTIGNWLCLQVLSGRSVGTLPGDAPGLAPIAGLDDDAKAGTYFTAIMPACQFAIAQDCLWWLNVRPVSVDHSILEVGGCFPQSSVEQTDFDVLAAPYFKRWEAVAWEDIGILEKQQRALRSPKHTPGRLGPREAQVQLFDAAVLRALGRYLED